MEKTVSKETVKQFIERGGIINKLPPAAYEEEVRQIYVPLVISRDNLSLGDAELRLAPSTVSSRKEAKKMISKEKVCFSSLLKRAALPQDVKNAIMQRIKDAISDKD
jgi:hypothetical protein